MGNPRCTSEYSSPQFERIRTQSCVAFMCVPHERTLFMRKTKENLAKPPDKEFPESLEAQETANEEHYEEIGGESATEGVGPGFDADTPDGESEEEKAES